MNVEFSLRGFIMCGDCDHPSCTQEGRGYRQRPEGTEARASGAPGGDLLSSCDRDCDPDGPRSPARRKLGAEPKARREADRPCEKCFLNFGSETGLPSSGQLASSTPRIDSTIARFSSCHAGAGGPLYGYRGGQRGLSRADDGTLGKSAASGPGLRW